MTLNTTKTSIARLYCAIPFLLIASSPLQSIAQHSVDVMSQAAVRPESGLDELMKKSIGSTYSEKTPMGKYFAGLKTTTKSDKKWLNDSKAEPTFPRGKEEQLTMQEAEVDLYPFGSPIPSDCNQRMLGNCSAISVFAELAYINPDFITSIIKVNKDKSFTVNMFDPSGKPIKVRVSNKFMTETKNDKLAGIVGKNGQATWASVLEKALMKYIDTYALVHSIEGIGSEFASPPFTGNGNSFAFSPGTLSAQELKKVVDESLAAGKIVIGGFLKSDVVVGHNKTVSAHAWSFSYAPNQLVNGYQPLFVMRNPWGNDTASDRDGLMYIPEDSAITGLIDLRIIDAGVARPRVAPAIFTPPTYGAE